MKKIFSFFIVVFGSIVIGQTQSASNIPSPTPYAIVSRDANSRVWERTTYEQSASGNTISHTESYKELATGLCYKQNGQWMDSQEQINILSDGSASATNGQHEVYFPSDIYNGLIKIITRSGKIIQSQPLGLSYFDGTNTVLIAELTNSIGQLISSNQIVYPNAFTGVSADLLYTYTKAGLEQDVILNEQPPSPEAYGLNFAMARLELVTEFSNPPQPNIISCKLQPAVGVSLTDDLLDFGSMEMIRGRAFLLGTNADGVSANIAKQWVNSEGRQFLIEDVPVMAIANQLAQLPAMQTSSIEKHSPLNVVSTKRLLPPIHIAGSRPVRPIHVARAEIPARGLLMDYQIINSGSNTNFTFQGDTTYYISGALDLFGTNTFEGGSVIKFASGASINLMPSSSTSAINWQADAYRPVIFTAKDDNTVGQSVTGSTGSPTGYYADPALDLDLSSTSAPAISDFRIAYAKQAVELQGSMFPEFYDGQVVNCQNGITVSGGNTIYLRNLLFGNVQTNFNNIYNSTFDVQNSTFSSNTYLMAIEDSPDQTVDAYLTNCVFANVVNLTNNYTSDSVIFQMFGADNGFYSTTSFGSSITTSSLNPFVTAGAASYYLTNECVFHNIGTTNIDPNLLVDLADKTTYPPIIFNDTNVSYLGTLAPIVDRDNSSALDLGYHYDPLDYIFGGCDIHSNVNVAVGTAIGWYETSGASSGEPYGLSLDSGANLSFTGTATQPDAFARYSMVQEDVNGSWTTRGYIGGMMINGSATPYPQLSGNFTKFTTDGAASIFRDSPAYGSCGFRNCEFYCGDVATYEMQSADFTNCLFFRNQVDFWDQDYAVSFAFENCTFYNGFLFMGRYDGNPYYDSGYSSSFWLIENTTFDGTGFKWTDNLKTNAVNTLFDFNAYNTNNLSWQTYSWPYPPDYGTNEVVGPNDIMITNYNWQSSWFGDFYLPSNSRLINVGSTSATNVGLYHFTTQTNQVPETNSIVDIGYHYVATDQYGNPLDSNGDGIPDYLEDPSGNGSGNWDSTLFLKVLISQPESGTTLP